MGINPFYIILSILLYTLRILSRDTQQNPHSIREAMEDVMSTKGVKKNTGIRRTLEK